MEHYGTYFGSDLTTEQYDTLALENIKEALLEKETELFGTKWFDYRHLHPTNATYLFAHLYSEAYKEACMKMFDVEKGAYNKGWKGKDFIEKKERGGFWKARQKADELCIPYNYYIRFAIDSCLGRCWKRIPRPTQLYSEACIEHIELKWKEELSAGLVEPVTAHLRAENMSDEQIHKDMQRWACSVLQTRKNAHFGLSHYMFNFPIISKEIALEYFDYQMIAKAKQAAV